MSMTFKTLAAVAVMVGALFVVAEPASAKGGKGWKKHGYSQSMRHPGRHYGWSRGRHKGWARGHHRGRGRW